MEQYIQKEIKKHNGNPNNMFTQLHMIFQFQVIKLIIQTI